jgi:hypothetical protein
MLATMSHTKDLIEALEHPKWRELVSAQFESEPSALRKNLYWFSKGIHDALKPGVMESGLVPNVRDCERLLELGLTGQFPALDHREHARATLIGFFHALVHPSFATVIEKHYGNAPDWERGYALCILCRQPDDGSFETMARLLDQYGVPASPFPDPTLADRHLGKIRRLMPNLLLTTKYADQLATVMNIVNRALEHHHLSLDDLSPVAEPAQREAARLLSELHTLLESHGSEARYEEEYEDLRVALGVYLDLVGILPVTSREILERAQSFADARVALFAIVSLLKKQIEPAQAAIERCASSHAVRDDLYTQLKHLKRLDLFPPQYLNRDFFAACEMVRWLMYPSELGREPEALELVAKIEGKSEDDADSVMYLWKCTSDGSVFACANGPYRVDAEVGELVGGHSFSDFKAWDEATPEQHLAEIVGRLANGQVSWCSSYRAQ